MQLIDTQYSKYQSTKYANTIVTTKQNKNHCTLHFERIQVAQSVRSSPNDRLKHSNDTDNEQDKASISKHCYKAPIGNCLTMRDPLVLRIGVPAPAVGLLQHYQFITLVCSLHQFFHYISSFITPVFSLHQFVHYTSFFITLVCSLHQFFHYTSLFITLICSLH